MNDSPVLLQATGLGVEIAGPPLVRDLDLSLRGGQFWCLLGRNGAGKTTLLHTLAGLRAAEHGSVELDGRPLSGLPRKQVARRLGVLLQQQHDSFPSSVRETVLQGRHPYLHAWQWETAADQQLVTDLLHRLELHPLQGRNVQTLSGGERQRVAIATLLAQQTDVLLMDEPLNHLDVRHRLAFLKILQRHCRESGHAAIMSLHDINLAARFCDHALLLLGEGEVRQGAVGQLFDSPTLEAVYGYPLEELSGAHGRAWLPR